MKIKCCGEVPLKLMPLAQAHVELLVYDDDGARIAVADLVSNTTLIMRIRYIADNNNGVAKLLVSTANSTYSNTTRRHVNRFTTEWLGQNYYQAFKRNLSVDLMPIETFVGYDCDSYIGLYDNVLNTFLEYGVDL